MVSLGIASATATSFLEEGESGDEIGTILRDKLDATELDEAELVARFAKAGSGAHALDGAFKKAKVVRNGVVKIVKRSISKVILSSAQKNGLKKARRKAHTATARLSRKKSLKVSKRRGLT
jgi:hypothetical protein